MQHVVYLYDSFHMVSDNRKKDFQNRIFADVVRGKGKAENKKSIVKYVKWYTPEKEKQYPTSFKVDFEGQPHEGACYYRITRCPICAYAEKLGVSELMPLFCELDEVMITLQHGVLHRKQTLANGGEYCDYFITGNRE